MFSWTVQPSCLPIRVASCVYTGCSCAASSYGSTPNRIVPPLGHELLLVVAVLPVPPHEIASSAQAPAITAVRRLGARGIGPPPVTARQGGRRVKRPCPIAMVRTPGGGTVKGWRTGGVLAGKG